MAEKQLSKMNQLEQQLEEVKLACKSAVNHITGMEETAAAKKKKVSEAQEELLKAREDTEVAAK